VKDPWESVVVFTAIGPEKVTSALATPFPSRSTTLPLTSTTEGVGLLLASSVSAWPAAVAKNAGYESMPHSKDQNRPKARPLDTAHAATPPLGSTSAVSYSQPRRREQSIAGTASHLEIAGLIYKRGGS